MKRFLCPDVLCFPATAPRSPACKIDDKARLGSAELVLNGAGLRKRSSSRSTRWACTCRGRPTNAAGRRSAAEGPKRVSIHMLRDVGAAQFTTALVEGIRENHTEAEVKALEPRVSRRSP